MFLNADSDGTTNGNHHLNAEEKAWIDANSQLGQEEQDIEKAISGITEVQVHFIWFNWLVMHTDDAVTYLMML